MDSFEALSITGKFVPVIPGGSHIRLTYANRKEYCEKALQFRLHELDIQVAIIWSFVTMCYFTMTEI